MGLFDFWKRKPETAPAKRYEPQQHNEPLIPTAERDPSEHPSGALKTLARPTWRLGRELGEGPVGSTRTGGLPDMSADEPWPDCGKCEKPLSFLFQLDMDALPANAPALGGGLLRLFYCVEDDCIGEGEWEAFSVKHALPITGEPVARRDVPSGTHTHPAAHLVQWVPATDYPNWEDRDGLIAEIEQDAEIGPHDGHKLGGWPFWVQGQERPHCTVCKAVMEPFVQLDAAWDFSFGFGDIGIGHISQCKDHQEIFAFAWACT